MKTLNISLALILFLMSFQCLASEAPALKLGIVPQHTPQELAKAWIPIAKALERALKRKVIFVTAPSINEFSDRLAKGEYDIAYSNPYTFWLAHKKANYQAIAREDGSDLQGILVVKKGGPLKKIQQIRGKKIAFPSPNAFAASILMQLILNEKMHLNIEPIYVNSHDSVYQNVVAGAFPAGGGVEKTFNKADESIKSALEIVYRTPKYHSHPISVHPRLDQETIKSISSALWRLAEDADGKEGLLALSSKGWIAAKTSDYQEQEPFVSANAAEKLGKKQK